MDSRINNQYYVVSCGDKLTLETLAQQKESFSQALLANKNIIFDVNALNKIDTPALQLFLIFILTLKQLKIEWQWQSPTNDFVRAAELLGMKELLKLDAGVNNNAH